MSDIYNMPKLSKIEKEKKKGLDLLKSLKPKFNVRTYESLLVKITNFRKIDAVKRFNDNIENLKGFDAKNITKTKLKDTIDKASGQNAVREFNRSGKDITIKNLTPNKLKKILQNLDVKQKIILNAGKENYTLRSDKIKKLIDDVDSFWVSETETKGSDAELIQEVKNLDTINLFRPKWLGKDHNEGAFFPYYNKSEIDLTDFQIFKNNDEANYDENCFVYALRQSNMLTGEELYTLKSMCIGLYIPTNKISKICEKFKIYIRIKHLNHHTTKNYGNKKDSEIVLGLIDKHYFFVKQIPYTMYSIENYESIKDIENWNQIYKKRDNLYKKDSSRYTNSFEAIKYLIESDLIKPIPYEDIISTQYYKEANEILDLNYCKHSVRPNEIKEVKDKTEDSIIIYFDFETITNEEIHKPYMVASSETKTFIGEKCGLYLLRNLYEKFAEKTQWTKTWNKIEEKWDFNAINKQKKLILIAHNAGYDFRFLQEYLNMESLCERGHNLLEGKGKFYYSKGKSIDVILKDSYSVITMPLKKFGKCFNLIQEKEILPYNLYTRENVVKRYLPFNICKDACDIQVRCDNIERIPNAKDYTDYFDKFIANAKKWDCIRGDSPLTPSPLSSGLTIDIIKYSQIYCEKDVEVLKLGYEKFGELLLESCNINIVNFMSSAQLAHNYMLNNNVFEKVNEVSSIPRDYIMKTMVGGRTMCANNKKIHIKDRLQDFDAVSLYPSAMYRLGGYLKGNPKVLKELNYDFLKNCDGYFVQIKVNKVNKKYPFPLMSYINDDGVRIFTNNPPNNLYVCKFDLEDLIKFHKIEFDIIDGYYYDEGRNYNLRNVIDFVFNERLKMKKEGNPLQEVWKLIMNSAYGKTLQKSHPETIEFKNENTIDKFVDKNYNYIKSYLELHSEDSFKKYLVKMEKGIEDHFNNAHCGVEVLAMSKRIMNEVMCLAHDQGLEIYYQDTDSMHIKECDIDILAKKYQEIYNRELIGKSMGQFHSDFDSDIIKKNICAIESIFLGKKCYIDKLEGYDLGGNLINDYHIRMKGISNNSIKHKAKIEARDFIEIYKSLFNENEETFDLCCGGEKINFEYNNDYTISTKKEFNRTLTFIEVN